VWACRDGQTDRHAHRRPRPIYISRHPRLTRNVTSGQSNLNKTASPPQTDGSIVFASWRQCALSCGHTGVNWRIQLNLCFLRPTLVHNPSSTTIGSAVFGQVTVESPHTLPWATLSPKLSLFLGESGPHLIHDPLGHSEPTIQTESRSLQPFSHR